MQLIKNQFQRDKLFDINLRLIYGFRTIGKDLDGSQMLCGIFKNSALAKFSVYVKFLRHVDDTRY